MCNAKKILANYGLSNFGSSANVYKLKCESGDGTMQNYGNNPTQNYNNAISCLDRELSEGNPVIVGVDHSPGDTGNSDNTTDHFVVITGRGYDSSKGKYYYTYMETARSSANATSACDTTNNRFYYDPSVPSLKDDSAYGHPKGYTVTQVRPNDGNLSGTISASANCY